MTRYRLDSQFHCSYLESRGVPGGKTREVISLSFPVHDIRWRNFRWCNFRSRLRTRSLPAPPHSTPTNAVWAVLIYYCQILTILLCDEILIVNSWVCSIKDGILFSTNVIQRLLIANIWFQMFILFSTIFFSYIATVSFIAGRGKEINEDTKGVIRGRKMKGIQYNVQ